MRTEKEYKNLTVKEFTKAAEIYETDHAGIYEMCKDDYLDWYKHYRIYLILKEDELLVTMTRSEIEK